MAVPRAEGDTRVAVFCWAAEILMCTASSQSVPARTVPLPLIFAARAIDNAICCRDWFPGIEPFPRVVPLLCQTTALSLFGVLAELWVNLALTSGDAIKSHLIIVEEVLKRTP